jgi:uncharacterized protein (DUF2236 family)
MYHARPLGPDSQLWRYAGDTRIAFMGATIGLLQLMHPAIGAGVEQHSDFFNDPFDRVFRSLPPILGVVYDEDGEGTGRIVRDYHKPIKGVDAAGRRYHALDPATYWWAHATFQFMAEQVADRWSAHRLTAVQRAALYADGVEWYRRYGVSTRPVPPTRAAFQVEWDRVCSEVLELTPSARWVLDMVTSERLPPLPDLEGVSRRASGVARSGPARRLLGHPGRLVAIGGLPAVVRQRFGIPWSRRDQWELDAIERAVRAGWRFVPEDVRWQPRALEAWQRVRAVAA